MNFKFISEESSKWYQTSSQKAISFTVAIPKIVWEIIIRRVSTNMSLAKIYDIILLE